MIKVLLVLTIFGGDGPRQATLEQPDVETCVAQSIRFLTSDYFGADGVKGLSANCVVIKVPSEKDANVPK